MFLSKLQPCRLRHHIEEQCHTAARDDKRHQKEKENIPPESKGAATERPFPYSLSSSFPYRLIAQSVDRHNLKLLAVRKLVPQLAIYTSTVGAGGRGAVPEFIHELGTGKRSFSDRTAAYKSRLNSLTVREFLPHSDRRCAPLHPGSGSPTVSFAGGNFAPGAAAPPCAKSSSSRSMGLTILIVDPRFESRAAWRQSPPGLS